MHSHDNSCIKNSNLWWAVLLQTYPVININNNYSFTTFEDYTQPRKLIPSFSQSACFAHYPSISVLTKSNRAHLRGFVRLSSTNTGHHVPSRKGLMCRPACAENEEQSMSNCLLSSNGRRFKTQHRQRVQLHILQTSQGCRNHPSSKKSHSQSKGRCKAATAPGLSGIRGGGGVLSATCRSLESNKTRSKQWRGWKSRLPLTFWS